MSWPDEVMNDYSRDACRFRLVEIAFEHMVHEGRGAWSREELATRPVALADATLAEMEKDVRSAAEIEEDAHADAVFAYMAKKTTVLDAKEPAYMAKPEAKPSTEKDPRPTRTDDGGLLV